MKPSSLLGHVAQLLKIIIKSPQPADTLTSLYSRERKYIGSKERRALSEITFGILRLLPSAQWCSQGACLPNGQKIPDEVGIVIAGVYLLERYSVLDVTELLMLASPGSTVVLFSVCNALLQEKVSLSAEDSLAYVHQVESQVENVQTNESSSVRLSVEQWILDSISAEHINFDPVAFGKSLLMSAPLALRVNTKLADCPTVLSMLLKAGYLATLSRLSPDGIVMNTRTNLQRHPLMEAGVIEVQDIGSQLIGFAVNPQPTWRILDACAGAGGKSLHLAALQKDLGHIHASDIEPKRMKELYYRSKRASLSSVWIQPLQTLPESKRKSLEQSYDAVLIDAPCSGIGTCRRQPLIKQRLEQKQLSRITKKQLEIFEHYQRYVSPNGVLVYATCSFLPQENEHIVNEFLSQNTHFVLEPLSPVFAENGIEIEQCKADATMITLFPHIHQTDGFFMARLRRIE